MAAGVRWFCACRARGVSAGRGISVTDKQGQVLTDKPFKLWLALVGPPEPFLGEIFLEGQNLAPLVRFRLRFGFVGPLIEVHHDVWTARALPRVVGAAKFVLGARVGILHRSAEAFPKNPDEDVAVLDA